MRRHRATRVAASALTLLLGFSLAGCFVPLRSLFPSQPSATPTSAAALRVHSGDLQDLILDRDSPDGARFREDFFRSSFDEATDYATETWATNGGSPQECYDSYASSFLVSPDQDEAARPFINIGEFVYDYEVEGLLISSGRLFDDEDSALAFLDFVRSASAACELGYELSALEGSGWVVERVEAIDATNLDLPDGATIVHHLESPDSTYAIQYRDTLVQYLNAVVVITCEVHAESPFDFDDCDALAETVAERLAAVAR